MTIATKSVATDTISLTDYNNIANAINDLIGRMPNHLVQVQRSRMFGLAGDAVYSNATTAWTAIGAQFKAGPGYGLLAKPSGATRRWRMEVVFQCASGSGGNIWLMTGGAPGTGTVQVSLALPFTGAPAGTYHGLYVSANTVGDPYNSADATWYGQSGTAANMSVWSIECVVEDYIP